jgi:hypothetical protein
LYKVCSDAVERRRQCAKRCTNNCEAACADIAGDDQKVVEKVQFLSGKGKEGADESFSVPSETFTIGAVVMGFLTHNSASPI